MLDETHWLLGCWRLHWAEPELEILPETQMEFLANGSLIYTINLEDKQAVFELVYRLEGTELRTFHQDGGHATVSRISIERDGRLQFDFDGCHAWFKRAHLI